MIYKCTSFEQMRVPADASFNPNGTYFKATFENAEDPWDLKPIVDTIFPANSTQEARFLAWADGDVAAIPNIRYKTTIVELEPFYLRDNKTGLMNRTIPHTSMKVSVRLKRNDDYVPGQSAEFIQQEDPKAKALQIVRDLGEFCATTTAAPQNEGTILPPPAPVGAPVEAPVGPREGDLAPDGSLVFTNGAWAPRA